MFKTVKFCKMKLTFNITTSHICSDDNNNDNDDDDNNNNNNSNNNNDNNCKNIYYCGTLHF